MSKKNKYFKWVSDYKQDDFTAIVKETDKTWESIRYDGQRRVDIRTKRTLCSDYWKLIPYSEFRKLKAELLKGKK